MAISKITAQGTSAEIRGKNKCCRENKSQNGTKLSYSPKDGQASGVFTQINNMKTRGMESSPIADDEY